MSTAKRVSITFSLLAALMCTVGFILPWFEYRTMWEPPMFLFGMESFGWDSEANPVYKHLELFVLGPDLYPDSGCYVVGRCGSSTTPDIPTRLHVSELTNSQVRRVQVARFCGVLVFVVCLIGGGFSLIDWVRYAGRKYGWRRALLWMGVGSLILAIVLCAVILVSLGPLVSEYVVQEPAPSWGCRTTTPSVECPRLPGGDPSLPSGAATWEFKQLIPVGLILVGLSFSLQAVAAVLRLPLKLRRAS